MEDFVTENRNQPINRNPSMWRNRDISEEYIRNAFESRLWGWVISDQRCRIYNIFNILNSFRLTSKLKKILSYLGHIPLKGSCIDCKLYTGFLRKSLKNWGKYYPFLGSPVEFFGRNIQEPFKIDLFTWFLSISASWSSASPCSWKVMMMRATKMLTKKKGKTMK